LVLIQYEVNPAKREGFLAHAREMREHAREVLGLDYGIHEDREHANRFVEIFTCGSLAEYEALDERQDDRFRELIARLASFTDIPRVRYGAFSQIT
jgi:quinol monooxygenase YgiN